jgi:hypothetical protein
MTCPKCRHENRPQARFCDECAAPLARRCTNCGAEISLTAKFCSECAHPTGIQPAPAADRFGAPDSYTPRHLAKRILTSRAALEGKRKQVTVLFADLKGSMELLADRDPEEARKILDPVLAHMVEAVHRYEGTVNQVMGDGIHGALRSAAVPRGPRGASLLCRPEDAGIREEVRGQHATGPWPHFPELEHTFKHALTHEVAYGTLLGDRRRGLHARIVEAIERLHVDRPASTSSVSPITRSGGKSGTRPSGFHEAGARAFRRSTNIEAIAYFRQGLELVGRLSPGSEQMRQELRLLLALGPALQG